MNKKDDFAEKILCIVYAALLGILISFLGFEGASYIKNNETCNVIFIALCISGIFFLVFTAILLRCCCKHNGCAGPNCNKPFTERRGNSKDTKPEKADGTQGGNP